MGSERPEHLNMWTLPREGVSSLRHTPHTRARVYDLCGQDHGGAQNVHVATQNEDFRVTLDLEQKKKHDHHNVISRTRGSGNGSHQVQAQSFRRSDQLNLGGVARVIQDQIWLINQFDMSPPKVRNTDQKYSESLYWSTSIKTFDFGL